MSEISAATQRAERGSRVDGMLRPFGDVRAGEGPLVLRLAATVLLLLMAYYLVKPLREGWLSVSVIGGLSKMEVKAYSGFGQTLALAALLAVYGPWSLKWRRVDLLRRSWFAFAATMVLFWALQPGFFLRSLPGSGVAFYLWVGIFGVFVVAQFFAFVADLFDDEQGRRLLPIVVLGSTLGAVVGSWLADWLVSSGVVHLEYLLLLAVVPLLLAQRLVVVVVRHVPRTPPAAAAAVAAIPVREGQHPLALVMGTRLLLAMATVTLLLSWVSTNGENILFGVVQESIRAEIAELDLSLVESEVRSRTTAFYARFYVWVNSLALFLQAIVASRMLRHGGFGPIFLMLPVLALVSYSVMIWLPILAVVGAAKSLENATAYSISNTARHVFWLPLAREVTFQAKPAIDSFVARFGDGLAALTVLLGVQALEWTLRGFLVLNLGLIALWLACGVATVRMHRRIAPSAKAGRFSDLLMGPRGPREERSGSP